MTQKILKINKLKRSQVLAFFDMGAGIPFKKSAAPGTNLGTTRAHVASSSIGLNATESL